MARPNKQHILKILKYNTFELVDSSILKMAKTLNKLNLVKSLKRNASLTISISHLFFSSLHIGEISHNILRQVFESSQLNLQRLQFLNFGQLHDKKKAQINFEFLTFSSKLTYIFIVLSLNSVFNINVNLLAQLISASDLL
jgi:hypothetical protein